MDETPVYLDMFSDTTIDFIGAENDSIVTTGREKYRLTVLLSICANGWKLPPLVVVKGESGKTIENKLRKLDFCQKEQIFVYTQKSGWCTNEIMEEWIKKVYSPYSKWCKEKVLLIIDQAPSHVSDISIKMFKSLDINYLLIPPGLTSILQPLDIGVNKIFKEKLKFKFEQYKIDKNNINENFSLQDARIRLLNFINEIWYNDDEIPPTAIINSFNKSGITTINYASKSKEKITNNCINDLLMYENNYGKKDEANSNINNISFNDLNNNNIIIDGIDEEYGINKENCLNESENENMDIFYDDFEYEENEG